MNNSIHRSSALVQKKVWYVGIYLLLLSLLFISSILEYRSRQREILHLLQDQASATATAIARGGSQNARLSADLEQSYIQRAFDLLRTVDRLDRDGLLTKNRIEDLTSDHAVFRLMGFDADGKAVLGHTGMRRLRGPGAGRGLLRRLEPILNGEQDTLVVGLGGRPWWTEDSNAPASLFLVAIRRTRGGVFACQLTVRANDQLQTALNLKQTLEEMLMIEGVVYLWVDLPGGPPLVVTKDQVTSSDIIAGERDTLDTRLFWIKTPGGPSYIEVARDITTATGSGRLHIGFATDHLSHLKRTILFQILIRSGLLTILAVVLFFFLISRQNAALLQLEKARIEEEVRRLEQINRLREKQATIGELAAGVAHEIRNPLNAVGILAQRLKREFEPQKDAEEYAQLSDTMIGEISRINQILENFLEYSRPIPIKPGKINVQNLFQEIVTLYETQARDRGIKLNSSVSGSILLNGDPQYLKQAMANIVKNALEATASGGEVHLSARDDKETVTLTVRDTGKGIDPENKNRIFDLFYSTKETGTGVGLAITHKIVADHGGTIEVKSEPGQGTTFILTFPKGDI